MFKEHPELLLLGALITGVISLVSLILSKEMKISDARLKWNEDLRAELAKMLAGLKYITKVAQVRLEIKGDNSRKLTDREKRDLRADLKEQYTEALRAMYHSKLFVDPGFVECQEYGKLIEGIKEIEKNFWSGCDNIDQLEKLYKEVESAALKVLVFNWNKVERGEKGFRRAKLGLLVGTPVLISLALVLSAINYALKPEVQTTHTKETPPCVTCVDPKPHPSATAPQPEQPPEALPAKPHAVGTELPGEGS